MWSVRLVRHQLARHPQLAAAALIAALIALNYLVFEHAFGVNYFRWYVENNGARPRARNGGGGP